MAINKSLYISYKKWHLFTTGLSAGQWSGVGLMCAGIALLALT